MSRDAPRDRVTPGVEGIVFDKDGTLFDFQATWAAWTARLIGTLARAHGADAAEVARAAGFDLEAMRFLAHSPVIAGTNREAAECLAQAMPGADVDAVEEHMKYAVADMTLVPAVPLAAYLDGLGARGLVLGVITNDTEFGARAHLGAAGVTDRFAFVAGFDSGHGAKPAPDPLLAFARATGLDPARVLMVGDSAHDLIAGRAAGMQTAGVLTGVASRADLGPLADVVVPDIGHIPAWLDR
jgi:phosphoglycolate phosphatase